MISNTEQKRMRVFGWGETGCIWRHEKNPEEGLSRQREEIASNQEETCYIDN